MSTELIHPSLKPSDNTFAGGSLQPVEVEVWSMERLGYLEVATPSGLMIAEDFLPHVINEIARDRTGMYDLLIDTMEAFGQVVPLFISGNRRRIRDGIHRMAIAKYTLEWDVMTVSGTRIIYSQWDESDVGRKYHKLWRERVNRNGKEQN